MSPIKFQFFLISLKYYRYPFKDNAPNLYNALSNITILNINSPHP